MNVREIKNKLLQKQNLSDKERAFLIANDIEALSAFMIKNNLGSVNLSLKKLGYTTTFVPNEANVTRQIQIILNQSHKQDFKYILDNFKIDLSKIHSSDKNFIQELSILFKK